jgi:hypothetical protein
MTVKNVHGIRRMIARLQATSEIQAIIARHTFAVVDAVPMILDLNSRSQDYRHRLAFQWCEKHTSGRWRRRISERRGHAILDTVTFEFERMADATALREWLKAREWLPNDFSIYEIAPCSWWLCPLARLPLFLLRKRG